MVFETVAILPPKLIGALQRRNRCGISKSGFLSVDCTLILLEIVTERFCGSIDASGPTPGGKYLSIKPPVAANGCELQLLCPLLVLDFLEFTYVPSRYVTSTHWRILPLRGSVGIGPLEAGGQTSDAP